MITDLTSSYLERLQQEKATAEIKAGTIVISDTERLVPVGNGFYMHMILPPKEVRDRHKIPIIYKRHK